jgi:phosphoglycolate phosphatase
MIPFLYLEKLMSKELFSIVFDLDGTLIDSVPDVAVAVNKTLEEEGRRTLSLEEARNMVGQGAKVMIDDAMRATGIGLSPERLDECVERYINHYKANPTQRTIIYPGVISALDVFAAEGRSMSICSNKPSVMTDLVLKELDLQKYFSVSLGGDQVPHRKPDGRHILQTLKLMGAAVERAIMVGDSVNDIQAAKQAGLPVVAVSYGYCKDPAALGADTLIDSFHELPGALSHLESLDR